MANMSYCRFENTSRDMEDCLNAIEDHSKDNGGDLADFYNTLSDYEKNGLRQLIMSAQLLMEVVDNSEVF